MYAYFTGDADRMHTARDDGMHYSYTHSLHNLYNSSVYSNVHDVPFQSVTATSIEGRV